MPPSYGSLDAPPEAPLLACESAARDVYGGPAAPDVSHLITEDDTPVDNLYSEKQQRLLTEPLFASWPGPLGEEGERRPFVAMANVGLFAVPKNPAIVPDVLLSVDATFPTDLAPKEHRSYFVWLYGKVPDVVIEVVSNREGGELDGKRRKYAVMRVPYYVVWDPHRFLEGDELVSYELVGHVYRRVRAPRFETLGLELVPWEGAYEGLEERWLRWRSLDGEWIATGAERANTEKARADAEHLRAESERAKAELERAKAESERAKAESERARAERLAERLRALGFDPDAP
jgi:hypothetical protein